MVPSPSEKFQRMEGPVLSSFWSCSVPSCRKPPLQLLCPFRAHAFPAARKRGLLSLPPWGHGWLHPGIWSYTSTLILPFAGFQGHRRCGRKAQYSKRRLSRERPCSHDNCFASLPGHIRDVMSWFMLNESLLCARYHSKQFTCIDTFNFAKNQMR